MASTDVEKGAALAVALAVKAFLTRSEWREPILVDSGNGFYLLYRGDDCDAEGDILKFALRFLANKFNMLLSLLQLFETKVHSLALRAASNQGLAACTH
jgi:hypothetical protein